VPGLRPLALTAGDPAGPCGELPTLVVAGLGPTQVMVDCVPPGASDVAVAVISVSGVSVALKVASFPSPHVTRVLERDGALDRAGGAVAGLPCAEDLLLSSIATSRLHPSAYR